MVKLFNKSYNIVYINCHEAAIELNFDITSEDIRTGVILFNVGWSLFSWGEKFKVAIVSEEPNVTKVELSTEAAVQAQIIDWGKNDSNVKKFFQNLTQRLSK